MKHPYYSPLASIRLSTLSKVSLQYLLGASPLQPSHSGEVMYTMRNSFKSELGSVVVDAL
jgi:hypothetical protein